MFLRDISMHCDHSLVDTYKDGFVARFNGEATCISALCMFLLRRKVVTDDIAKLYIRFGQWQHISGANDATFGTGVLSIHSPFPFSDYYQSADEVKKRLLHDGLQKICLHVALVRQWDPHPFESAYIEALHRNRTLEGSARRSWLSPNRHYRARVNFRYELDGVYLTCILTKASSRVELARHSLGKAVSGSMALYETLEDGEWISPTIFELRDHSFSLSKWRVDFAGAMTE